MQNTTTHRHWKTEISDLRSRAAEVTTVGVETPMSARTAARCLSGVIGHVVNMAGRDTMQLACAELVRFDQVWKTNFRMLPRVIGGDLAQAIELIAVVSRGILALSGGESLRAALSFWATEEDPAVWQRVTGVAA